MVKSTCTQKYFYLEYHTVAIKIDYTRIWSNHSDPNLVTMAL